jgi:hypothetical protein
MLEEFPPKPPVEVELVDPLLPVVPDVPVVPVPVVPVVPDVPVVPVVPDVPDVPMDELRVLITFCNAMLSICALYVPLRYALVHPVIAKEGLAIPNPKIKIPDAR